MARQRTIKHLKKGTVPWWKAVCVEAAEELRAGERPPDHASKMAQLARVGVDLELTLKQYGNVLDLGESAHPGAIDGRRGHYRQRKVRVSRGINKRGEPVDEKQVTYVGDEADEGLEGEAEGEALS